MYEKLRNRRVTHLLMAPCGQRNDGLRGQSTFFRLKISTTNQTSTMVCGCGGRFQYCQQPKKRLSKIAFDARKRLSKIVLCQEKDFARLLLVQKKDFTILFFG